MSSRTQIGAMVSPSPATPIINRQCNGAGSASTPIFCEEAQMVTDGAPAGWHYGASRCHYNFLNQSISSVTGDTRTALDGNSRADFECNRLPVITMKGTNGSVSDWANIVAGGQNANIDARGDELKAYQDRHRGQGKWGATFVWSFHHEPNGTDEFGAYGGSVAATGAAYIAATRYVYDRFVARGVTIWDGDADWTTRTEGLVLAINLVDGCSSNSDNALSKNFFWGPANGGPGPGDPWMDAHCKMFTTDPYPTGQMRPFSNLVQNGPGGTSTTNTVRSWGNAKRAYQESQGRVFLEGILETGSRQVTTGGTIYTGISSQWTATGLAPTVANWILNFRDYFRDTWTNCNLVCWWDDSATGWYEIDRTSAGYSAAITAFTDTSAFASALTPLPTGGPPDPPPGTGFIPGIVPVAVRAKIGG